MNPNNFKSVFMSAINKDLFSWNARCTAIEITAMRDNGRGNVAFDATFYISGGDRRYRDGVEASVKCAISDYIYENISVAVPMYLDNARFVYR